MSGTARGDQMASSSRVESYDSDYVYAEKGGGWIAFAGTMLILGGFFGLMWGIVALARSSFFIANAHYTFSNLHTWGLIVTVAGGLAILAGCFVFTGSQWARWLGILIAGTQALVQLFAVQAYPFWSLCIFAVDILVIYALATYGGKRLPTPT